MNWFGLTRKPIDNMNRLMTKIRTRQRHVSKRRLCLIVKIDSFQTRVVEGTL